MLSGSSPTLSQRDLIVYSPGFNKAFSSASRTEERLVEFSVEQIAQFIAAESIEDVETLMTQALFGGLPFPN